MADSDLIKLYSGRILRTGGRHPAYRPAGRAGRTGARSPLCGSTVTVDLVVADGRIARFGQDVKACALGQAAASVWGATRSAAAGGDRRAARDALHAMLKPDGPRRPPRSTGSRC